MNYYRQQFKNLLTTHDLDFILVYANAYNDRFMKAISGTHSIFQNYIIISKRSDYLTEAGYFLLDIQRRTDMKILPTEGEDYGFLEVIKKVGQNKRVGVVGDFKYRDFVRLRPAKIVDLTKEAHEIILYKTDEYISSLKKHASITAGILKKVRFQPGDTGAARARKIFETAIKQNYQLSFPTCVTSGEDLFKTTTVVASEKKIKKRDRVCVDMGLKQGIFTTDITRMFFVNHPEAEKIYQEFVAIHNDIIAHFVSPEKTFREVILHYKERLRPGFCIKNCSAGFQPAGYEASSFVEAGCLGTGRQRCLRYARNAKSGLKRNRDIKEVLEDDFGHSIGFALHEMPASIEKTSRAIGKNIVFTLEPTFVTKFGKMRIEDMIGIFSNGKVVNLTGGK